jgi:8-oxo-dGTP pyrophosphatase MutT (NUDIX family)
MHRRRLLEILGRYQIAHPAESSVVGRMRGFVSSHEDCFVRSCLVGHVTGSAWVLSADHTKVLLTHHAKLGRWLQLGGHCDGEADPFRVALREACEESGLGELRAPDPGDEELPLDVDVHSIPARPGEPAHLHYDVRYLLVAGPDPRLVRSPESRDLRWVERSRLDELSREESLLRLERKASARLAVRSSRARSRKRTGSKGAPLGPH